MIKKEGPGGTWRKPWNRLDYVQSMLNSCLYTLHRQLRWDDDVLLTADEVNLLFHIRTAMEIMEGINDGTT